MDAVIITLGALVVLWGIVSVYRDTRPTRSRELGQRPYLVGDAVGGGRELIDVVWDEQVAATDEAIARIDRELNRDSWNAAWVRHVPILVDDKSYPHGNWDPGQ